MEVLPEGRACLSRSLREMRDDVLGPLVSRGQSMRQSDGWCHPMMNGMGFRYDYDADIAEGGWEFYTLPGGICIAIVNMVTKCRLTRSHAAEDSLALSAVLDGNVSLIDPLGLEGELADGYCTVYGTGGQGALRTIYEPGEHLRWVTIYIDRAHFFDLVGAGRDELPAGLCAFIDNGGEFSCRNVPLSQSASLAAHQLIARPLRGGFRDMFMKAKAQELACYILFGLSQPQRERHSGCFLADDHRKLKHAMVLIRNNIDKQLNVNEIAESVGLTRQRLQLGFRMIYGDTVGRIRDKLRMELALDLIRDSQMSMIEIALETGYEHAASFTRAFKGSYGVSPIQMRKVANDELRLRNSGRRLVS